MYDKKLWENTYTSLGFPEWQWRESRELLYLNLMKNSMKLWSASFLREGAGARVTDGKGTGQCGMDVEVYYYQGICICIVYYDSIMGKIFCHLFLCLYIYLLMFCLLR